MGDSLNGSNGWRTDPMYTFSEAAHLARVSPGTVRNWLLGYTARDRIVTPLFRAGADQPAMVSFLHLVEIVVAATFRKAERISFQTVRRAYDYAREEYGLEYPFAHIRLGAIGGHIVHHMRDGPPASSFQTMDEPHQWTLPGLVQEVIEEQLYHDPDLAAQWYPAGKKVPIVVDPQFSSGAPTILGRGVTVGTIYRRWKDGNLSMDFIARDFQLDRDQVEQACKYAEQIAV